MITSSSEINKEFRKIINPVLKENGFSKTTARRSWNWINDCVWVFEIRAVGKYFSDVTGWPPMSICVWTGIFYNFIPFVTGRQPKINETRWLPNEVECHSRSHLTCSLNQNTLTKNLDNPAERTRRDIWWIEYDGSNIMRVAENIRSRFVEQGLPWYQKLTDCENLLVELEQWSCYENWFRAMHLTRKMGLKDKFEHYKAKVSEFELNL